MRRSKIRPSSIFGAEDRRPPIFDLRSRRPKNFPIFNLRSWELKIEDTSSSIFGPKNGSNGSDGRRRGGGTSSKMGGFFEDGGFFDFPAPKNEEPPAFSTFSARSTKNPFHLPSSRPEEWTKNPFPGTVLLLPTPPRPPAPLSYPEVWILRPIFHLGDRSEDRDRPSTPQVPGGQHTMHFGSRDGLLSRVRAPTTDGADLGGCGS